jgi:hypothetical protein
MVTLPAGGSDITITRMVKQHWSSLPETIFTRSPFLGKSPANRRKKTGLPSCQATRLSFRLFAA